MKENWQSARMSEVFDLQMGKTPSRDNPEYWGGSEVWVAIGDMGSSKKISSSGEKISVKAVRESGIKIVPEGCVIMSFKLSVGKVAIASMPLYTNEAIMSFRPRGGYKLLPDYIYYYLKGYKWDGINKAAKGLTLNKASISQGVFSYPSYSEQERIVAELDLLSSIIDKQKALLLELDTLAQSIFYDMFGNPLENERGWKTNVLKDSVIEMFLGPFGSSLKTECYVPCEQSFCMVYEQKHAIKKTLNIETHYITKEKYDSLRRFEVHSGDFIMSCRGTIGEIYRLPKDAPTGIIHPSLMKIRIREDIYNPTFFAWLLKHIIKNERTNGNCVQMAITAKELGKRAPILPPLKLQESFSEQISAIEYQKGTINLAIVESQKLFDYTMDKYFG